jgi:hypothetical protein
MREVEITLRFNRVCLGAVKKKKRGHSVFCFERDPAGRVMFLPSAWLSCLRYAAKLCNKHYAAVKKIDWCPVISGTPRSDWRRNIVTQHNGELKMHYAIHEAFKPGDKIVLSAVLPDEISVEDFDALLTVVGKYRGFSPFNNNQEKYGTFEVIKIKTTTTPELG